MYVVACLHPPNCAIQNGKRVAVLGSQFIAKLTSTGYEGVKNWNKEVMMKVYTEICVYMIVYHHNFFLKR